MNIRRDVLDTRWYRLTVSPILVGFLSYAFTWAFVPPQSALMAAAAGVGAGLGLHSYWQIKLSRQG